MYGYKNKAWLENEYKTKSINEIAAECGVASSTIRKYMKRFGIKSLSVSESMLKKYQDEEYLEKKQQQWQSTEYRQKHREIAAENSELKSDISRKLWEDERYRNLVVNNASEVVRSPEVREKLSIAAKKKWEDSKYREKQLQHAEESSRRFSEMVSAWWQEQDYRTKMTEQSRELWDDQEYRDKQHAGLMKIFDFLSKNSKALWKNEDYRKRTINTLKQSMTDEKKEYLSLIMKEYYIKNPQFKKLLSKVSKELWASDEFRRKFLATYENRFKEKARRIHRNNFDYSKSSYEISETADDRKILITCNRCNHNYYQRPSAHLVGCRCPKCNTSTGQREIYDYLRKFNIDIIINDRSTIGPLELDLFIPEYKFAIEYHGLRWHSFDRPESTQERTNLQRKALICNSSGIKLLQVFDYQWREQQNTICSMIEYQLGLSEKYDARKCEIKIIPSKIADQFCNEYHISKSRTTKHNFGLYYNNDLLMVATFGGDLEIIRLASKNGIIVRGGLSKLITYAERSLNPERIMTYVDLCLGDGKGYLNAGFELIEITKPGYFYYKNNTILSRQQCQKHKLSKLLEKFDENLSESINMFNNGFRRVWNAGNLKLIKS